MSRLHVVKENKIIESPRVAQVRGMFDIEKQSKIREEWNFDVELPKKWNIGLIVGPSGAGKTTIARELFGNEIKDNFTWSRNSILDNFQEDLSIKDITSIFTRVGFSSPPSWLKPYGVLSNGEKFRVDLARTILETPLEDKILVDEFTSVVDREVAKTTSIALEKFIRHPKNDRQFVAVGCHYDILPYLQPDWVIEPHIQKVSFPRSEGLQRPTINIEIFPCNRSNWEIFSKHHYLDHNIAKSCRCFLATVNGVPAGFIAIISSPHPKISSWRISRLVVLPDYQGIGLGKYLLKTISSAYFATGKRVTIVTSHPALIKSLSQSKEWGFLRKPSRVNKSKTSSINKDSSWKRITASLMYLGEPNYEYAETLQILKSNSGVG